MNIIRLVIIVLFVIVLNFPLFAQIPGIPSNTNSSKIEKQSRPETKAAEQILVEVKQLKFPQDRAYVLSYVGEYFCRIGEKDRAEKIFEESIREIIFAQNKAKKSDGNMYEQLIYGNYPRRLIIQSISNCDAEMAYKFLLQSRPPKLSQILDDAYKRQTYPEPKTVGDDAVSMEIEIESIFRLQIIQKRPANLPARVTEFINQDIENAITYRTIELIKDLTRRNSALAGELTEKAINKILTIKFYDYEKKRYSKTGYIYNIIIANSFLRELGNDTPRGLSKIVVSVETLKRLADKISSETINSGLYLLSSDLINTIEKFYPERIAQLEKVKADNLDSPDNLEKRKYRQMFKENLSDEDILTTSETFSETNKKNVFRLLACRQVREGNFDQAKNLIKEKYGEKGTNGNLLSYVFYSNALRFFIEKDFEKASDLAKQIPQPLLNFEAQIFLLERFYTENPEQNKAESLIRLSELIKEFNSKQEIEKREGGLGKILKVYAETNPEQAFSLFEFLIYQTNKTDDIDSFFDSPTGKIRLKSGIKFEYEKTVKHLAKSDIDKTLLIINKLNRPVSRINLKLAIIKNNYSDYYYEDILKICDLKDSPIRFKIFQ